MKIILSLIVFSLALGSKAAMDSCQIKSIELKQQCLDLVAAKEQFLGHCLRRRDTCNTARAQESRDECEDVHQCMQEHERTFQQNYSDIHPCRYYWNEKSNRCFVRRSLFSLISQCPGRITLTGTIIDGFSGGLDSSFNCSSQAHVLNQELLRCEAQKQEFSELCPDQAKEVLAQLPSHSSVYLTQRNQNTWGVTAESVQISTQDSRYFFYPQDGDQASSPTQKSAGEAR